MLPLPLLAVLACSLAPLAQARLGSADPSITIPFEFPMMKQCDPRWTDDLMDTKTICAVNFLSPISHIFYIDPIPCISYPCTLF